MSDCLFDAFYSALAQQGRDMRGLVRMVDYRVYQGIKNRWQADAHGYTEQILAPHIIQVLAARHGLNVEMQHRVYTLEAARQQAWIDRDWMLWLASYRWPNWGTEVEELSLFGAIYLRVTPDQHAYFRFKPTSVGHYMALRLTAA